MSPKEVSEFTATLNLPFTVSPSGILKLGPKPLTSFSDITDALAPEDRSKLVSFMGSYLGEAIKSSSWAADYISYLSATLRKINKIKKDTEKKEVRLARAAERAAANDISERLPESYINKEMTRPLSEQTLIIDVKSRKNSFLYCKADDVIYPHSFEVIKERLEWIFGKKGLELYAETNSMDCETVYEPNEPRILLKHIEDGKEANLFNRWSPAPWAKDWTPYVNGHKPKAPELFRKLLDFLVLNESDKYFVQAWLRDCTFTRAEPILVLCGMPGVGKNLFVDTVGRALVGDSHIRMASRGFSRSQFHSNVTSCRLFFLDETKLTDSAKETLKTYHNGQAAIERKNIDVGDPEKLHASFVLSNNVESYLNLDFFDRKFYAPDMNTESIEKILGREGSREFASEIIKSCKDHEFIQTLANYLHANFEEGESIKFQKNTGTFLRICYKSLPPWLINMKDIYTASKPDGPTAHVSRDVLKGIKNKPTYAQAKEGLDAYRIATGDNFADVVMNGDGSWNVIFNPGMAPAAPAPPMSGSPGLEELRM